MMHHCLRWQYLDVRLLKVASATRVQLCGTILHLTYVTQIHMGSSS